MGEGIQWGSEGEYRGEMKENTEGKKNKRGGRKTKVRENTEGH